MRRMALRVKVFMLTCESVLKSMVQESSPCDKTTSSFWLCAKLVSIVQLSVGETSSHVEAPNFSAVQTCHCILWPLCVAGWFGKAPSTQSASVMDLFATNKAGERTNAAA